MLPKNFNCQYNNIKRKEITSQMKLYTIRYDYTLNPYYGEYIKESFDKWGNIIDNLGLIQLTGYSLEEVEHNFRKIMEIKYIDTKKITDFFILDITHS